MSQPTRPHRTPAVPRALPLAVAGLAMAAVAVTLPPVVGPARATTGAATTTESFDVAAALSRFLPAGAGAWSVADGRLRLARPATQPTTAGPATAVQRRSVTGDFAIAAVATASDQPEPDLSLVFAWQGPADHSYLHLDADASRSGVYRVVAGTRTKLAAVRATVLPGRSYVMEVRRVGASLKAYANPVGAPRAYQARVSIGTQPATAGVGTWRSAARFDDLRVTGRPLGTAPTPAPTLAPTPTPAPTLAPTPTSPATSAPPVPPAPTAPAPTSARPVAVATSTQLRAALADARPGDVITLADGVYTSASTSSSVAVGGRRYSGTFVATRAGTAAAPIVLQGSPRAVIDGQPGADGTRGTYGLYLAGAHHWVLRGFTVRNAAKGVVLDATNRTTLEDVVVHTTGQEGIHLRAGSSDNVVRRSAVRLTGLSNPDFGEGIYVGSAVSNWGTYTGGLPDRSDRNQLLFNDIRQTGAESIDVKEGTTGGLIRGNVLDGAGMTGAYADSWIDLKGNDYLVAANSGTRAAKDGFQVHGATAGWGNGNVFRGNTAVVDGPGYGFWVQANTTGTVVACDNVVRGAVAGMANRTCGG